VAEGDPLATVLANDRGLGETAVRRLGKAISIGREKPGIPELIGEAI
jgi:hypothetical protein